MKKQCVGFRHTAEDGKEYLTAFYNLQRLRMTVTLPSLAKLKPNTAYASLPLFDRTGWKRVRFGDVKNLNVAGTRGSKEPDVWKFAYETLETAFFS